MSRPFLLCVALAAVSGGAVSASDPIRLEPRVLTNSIGLKLVELPAGKFVMGSPKDEKHRRPDEAQHEVELTRPFFMGVYEVAQEEYQKVMGVNPSYFSRRGGGKDAVTGLDTSRFPVEQVTWDDAVAFCRKLSALPEEKKAGRVYRLPTEAEWEYACRAGATGLPFHFGNTLTSLQANFNGQYPLGDAAKGPFLGRTAAVGSYDANAFGLFDMHGNVAEMCSDWYDETYYSRSPAKDPRGPDSGPGRVVRGGSWQSGRGKIWDCRTAERGWGRPSCNASFVGFRVVVEVADGK